MEIVIPVTMIGKALLFALLTGVNVWLWAPRYPDKPPTRKNLVCCVLLEIFLIIVVYGNYTLKFL